MKAEFLAGDVSCALLMDVNARDTFQVSQNKSLNLADPHWRLFCKNLLFQEGQEHHQLSQEVGPENDLFLSKKSLNYGLKKI